jgi:hypothetical protein
VAPDRERFSDRAHWLDDLTIQCLRTSLHSATLLPKPRPCFKLSIPMAIQAEAAPVFGLVSGATAFHFCPGIIETNGHAVIAAALRTTGSFRSLEGIRNFLSSAIRNRPIRGFTYQLCLVSVLEMSFLRSIRNDHPANAMSGISNS